MIPELLTLLIGLGLTALIIVAFFGGSFILWKFFPTKCPRCETRMYITLWDHLYCPNCDENLEDIQVSLEREKLAS